ncbi:MAG: DUF4342 domain-containing protein [Lachnospiraceae bacterium]|nr:DUF4342 domain-containing protein [Lachnospiraceae bacterium]
MELTIEVIEKVMNATGLDYAAAKALLAETDNDPDKAIEKFSGTGNDETKEKVDDIIRKIKDTVEEGNVDRIQISKDEQIVLSVPVNVGIIGGIIGAVAAPWALIAGAIAAFGFGCKIEVVKKDGTTDIVK